MVWVCHSVELCAQAESSMVRLLKTGPKGGEYIPFYGNTKELVIDGETPNILYVTYGKQVSYSKKFGLKYLASRLVLLWSTKAIKYWLLHIHN